LHGQDSLFATHRWLKTARTAAGAVARWRDARDGATAVEFGLIGGPALMLLYAIFNIGLFFFMERALDHATLVAARAIATGAVTTAGLSAGQFESQYVCPNLPSMFNCSNIFVQLSTVTANLTPLGYYAFVNSARSWLNQPPLNSTNDTFDSGASCQYIVLQVLYPQPFFFSAFAGSNATTFNGQSVSVLMSNATFKTEPYSGSASTAGC
jgi:Flp pilus assembly protein TadG